MVVELQLACGGIIPASSVWLVSTTTIANSSAKFQGYYIGVDSIIKVFNNN